MSSQRRLIVAENMSANGVIEFVDNWFDPGEQDQSDMLSTIGNHMKTEDALILGRQTFEDFRGFWPHRTDDTTGFTDHLNSVKKFVFSTSLQEPGWENTTILRGPIEDDVRALKNEPGNDIGITGSISIVHALMRADLVDEYRLFVYPVVTSRGRNLVPDGRRMDNLKLVESQAFMSGVVLLRYLPRG